MKPEQRDTLAQQAQPDVPCPTTPRQIWHQLEPRHRQQFLTRLIQVCQMLTQTSEARPEVQHDVID